MPASQSLIWAAPPNETGQLLLLDSLSPKGQVFAVLEKNTAKEEHWHFFLHHDLAAIGEVSFLVRQPPSGVQAQTWADDPWKLWNIALPAGWHLDPEAGGEREAKIRIDLTARDPSSPSGQTIVVGGAFSKQFHLQLHPIPIANSSAFFREGIKDDSLVGVLPVNSFSPKTPKANPCK